MHISLIYGDKHSDWKNIYDKRVRFRVIYLLRVSSPMKNQRLDSGKVLLRGYNEKKKNVSPFCTCTRKQTRKIKLANILDNLPLLLLKTINVRQDYNLSGKL